MVLLGSRTWEEQKWNIGDKEVWGRGMWIDLCGMVNLCVLSMHTKGWCQQRRILIISWIKCPILWITASFRATPVIAQWAHEQSDSRGRDESYAWTQQQGLPLFKADLATAMLSAQFASNTDQHWVPIMSPFPGGITHYLVGGWLYWTTSIMEGEAFCS